MIRKYLNNQQRILLHLSKYSNNIDNFIAPKSLTQEGIGDAVGIGRNNVPREMKKLMEEGLISSKKLHVNGVKNRRTVYFLMNNGVIEANRIKKEIKDIYVNVIEFSGDKKVMRLKDVQKKYGIDFILCAINLDRNKNLDLVSIFRKRERAFHSIDENLIVREFYGRKEELDKIWDWINSNKNILLLTGISGIGKTTFLLKFVKEKLKNRNVLFIKIEKWKSAENILYQIAGFFSRIGIPKIEKYVRSVSISTEKELKWNNALLLIKESLRDEILIFDNVENADMENKKFLRKIVDLVDGRCNFKIILSGTDIEDIVSPSRLGYVEEIKLRELNERDSLEMLRQHGVTEEKALKMISNYGGNPLILQIARNQDYDILRKFIFEGIIKTLIREEREALEFISVFRKPFKMNVLLLNNFEYFTIYSLINKNILLEMEYEKFTIHRVIRKFVYEHLTDEKRKRYHLMAAKYYEEVNDILEAVHHYTHAGKLVRANILLSENYERHLLERGGEIRKLAIDILNHYDKVVDDHEWQLYGIIGDTYRISGKWNDALENYKKAKFLSKGRDLDFYAKTLVSISEILGKRGEYKDAIKTLNDVFKNVVKIRDERIVSRAYYVLGIMMMKTGNMADSREYLMDSIKIAEKTADLKVIGYAYNGLGLMERKDGKYEDAVSHFKKARECFDACGDLSGLANAVRNIGLIYYDLYDDRAEKYIRESMKTSEKIEDKWGVGHSYLLMANWGMYKEKYFDAKKYLEKSEEIFKELNSPDELSYVYNSFGTFYAYLGDKKKGKEYFDKAIELAAKIGRDDLVMKFSREAMNYLKKYGYIYVENYEKIAKGEKKVVAVINI